jgi:hypothetical protein
MAKDFGSVRTLMDLLRASPHPARAMAAAE